MNDEYTLQGSTINPGKQRDLEIPASIDAGKIENLREKKEKVIRKITEIMQGGNVKSKAKRVFFSFYTPPQEPTREVGDKWIDSDGCEWEQRTGYKIKLPKIDREELIREGYLMPFSCPKCGNPLKHSLDRKLWPIHHLCFNCVQDFETDLRERGLYKAYERNKMMSNIRAFYNDVINGLEDYTNSFDATYVNEFGGIEKWAKADRDLIKTIVLNDLKLLSKAFEKEFGEKL